MFEVAHKGTGKVITVYAVSGMLFLVYDPDEELWGYVPMDDYRPVAGKEK